VPAAEATAVSQSIVDGGFVSAVGDDYAIDAQLQGIARPKREAFLRFPTVGQVSRIHIVEGAVATAGQPLVTLDDRPQAAEVGVARVAAQSRANIVQAEVAVKRALRALQRVKEARAVDASSEFEVEAKQNDYDEAVAVLEQQQELRQNLEAQLRLAMAKQDQMTITAPFDGKVVLIGVKEGNSVDNTTSVIQIADLSLLEVEMHLPSTLLGSLSVGETTFLIAGVPVSRKVPATIRYVSPVIEPTGGTFLVRLEIDNTDGSLPAGFEVWYR
jgi:HlyD family secretion protein